MTDAFDEAWDNTTSASGGDAFDAAWDSTPEPSTASNVWKDITDIPHDLWGAVSEIPSGASNVYNSIFSPIESRNNGTTDRTLSALGALAAGGVGAAAGGTAGAEGGALIGSMFGPIGIAAGGIGGGVLGGAAGAALSLYDYFKLSQAAGLDAPTTPAEDIAQARKNFVQGTVLGGGLKAAGALTSAAADYLRPGIQQDLVGYNPKLAQKASTGVDAAGELTQDAFKAKAQLTKKDLAFQDLQESGFFKKAGVTDSATSMAKKLWEHQQEAGNTIGEIIDDLAPKEAELMGDMGAPWQKNPIVEASPTFENAQALIDDVSSVTPKMGKTLARQLKDIKAAWENSPQDLKTLKEFQQKFGLIKAKSFNPKASTVESLADDLNKAIYGDLAGSLKTRIAAIDPEALPKFEAANKQYAASTTFKNSAFNAARKGGISKAFSDLFSVHSGSGLGATLATGAARVFAPGLALPLELQRLFTVAKDVAPVQTLKALGAAKMLAGAAQSPLAIGAALGANNQSTPNSYSDLFTRPTMSEDIKPPEIVSAKRTPVKEVEKEIDSDPFDKAVYEAESNRNPRAQPRDPKTGKLLSSAKGGFQFIDRTAKSLGLKDPFDLAQSYEAFKKLTAQNRKIVGNDPIALYAAHVLGPGLAKKMLAYSEVSKEEENLINYFNSYALPNFKRRYKSEIA